MNEAIIFKRRNRLKKHFVNVSNVLLYGYKALSDAAKITYQIIESFDWEDKETGDSKGYVFPSIEKIAQIRNAAKRTIFRHIQELEKVGLLTRVRRRNKASILYIEDISDTEANVYIARYVEKTKSSVVLEEKDTKFRTAKNGTSEKAGELPKMALAFKEEENELKENEINVNENLKIPAEKKRHGMEGMKDILRRFDTVQSNSSQKTTQGKKNKVNQKPEEKMKRDYFAQHMADELQDQKSLGCFRAIAETVPEPVIFETLGAVKETWKEGKIKKSRGALFVASIKTYCEKNQIKLAFVEA